MSEGQREQVERWFIRHGLPHLIDGYRADTDVFTRALPFLLLVFFFNVAGSFGDQFTGWGQAGIAAVSTLVILFAAALLNVLRNRRPFQVPDRVGPVELTAFVLLPTIPSFLFGGSPFTTAAAVIALNLTILGLVYFVVGYGLVPTTVWAAHQTLRHLSQLLTLMGRALPFVLVFSAFLFINAELWQVAHDFTAVSFWSAVGLLSFVAASFLGLRIPREIAEVAQFASWDRVCQLATEARSPLGEVSTENVSGDHRPPMSKPLRFNVGLVVLFNMGLQILLVSVAIGAFYTLFGVLAVREETILAWTSLETLPADDVFVRGSWLGTELVLTVQLVRVVGFLVAFSALQFAVAAVTDATYREEFFSEVTGEVREALAVRAVYLRQFEPEGAPAAE
ncbi:MAG: hypothetical protein AAF962_09145 [Actinomycetota bacterium]